MLKPPGRIHRGGPGRSRFLAAENTTSAIAFRTGPPAVRPDRYMISRRFSMHFSLVLLLLSGAALTANAGFFPGGISSSDDDSTNPNPKKNHPGTDLVRFERPGKRKSPI
jgi:hypothetical protein